MGRNWLVAVASLSIVAAAQAEEPARTFQIVSPKDDGIIATGINSRGEIVGFEWVPEKVDPGMISQQPILARGKEITFLPVLEGYTATFPAGISDDGVVVGRSSKPAPKGVFVALRNQAFIWDAKRGMRGLGTLQGDNASFACGITRDGKRIVGYSIGQNRIRACVWDRLGEGWQATAMPHTAGLGSNQVAMSDNGKFVSAVDGTAACLWSQDDSGAWTRLVISEPAQFVPRAVNNSGTVVGVRFTGDGLHHAMLYTRQGGVKEIEKPEGFVKSEASALNNEGVVVGLVDGPGGSKIGPNAFAYEAGRIRLIREGGPNFSHATAINDKGQIAGVMEKVVDEEPQQGPRHIGPAAKPK